MKKIHWTFLTLKMEGYHQLRNIGSLWSLEKAWNQFLPRDLQKKHSPADTLILVRWDPVWTSDLQNCMKINLCWFKLQSFRASCYRSHRKVTHHVCDHGHLRLLVKPDTDAWRGVQSTLLLLSHLFYSYCPDLTSDKGNRDTIGQPRTLGRFGQIHF